MSFHINFMLSPFLKYITHDMDLSVEYVLIFRESYCLCPLWNKLRSKTVSWC